MDFAARVGVDGGVGEGEEFGEDVGALVGMLDYWIGGRSGMSVMEGYARLGRCFRRGLL